MIRDEGRRRLRVMVAVGSLVAAAGLGAGLLDSPLFRVSRVLISIQGGGYPRRALLGAAGLTGSPPMIDVNASQVASRLDRVPQVASARVTKDWPSTVSIHVRVRQAVAVVPRGAFGWASVDVTGRVLDYPATPPPLPVLYGMGAVPPPGSWLAGTGGAGLRLDAEVGSPGLPDGTAAAVAIAGALPPRLRVEVLSITVAASGSITLSVLPPGSNLVAIPVAFGDGSLIGAKLTALATLLDEADLNGVSSLDITVPDRPVALTARQTTGTVSTHAGG